MPIKDPTKYFQEDQAMTNDSAFWRYVCRAKAAEQAGQLADARKKCEAENPKRKFYGGVSS